MKAYHHVWKCSMFKASSYPKASVLVFQLSALQKKRFFLKHTKTCSSERIDGRGWIVTKARSIIWHVDNTVWSFWNTSKCLCFCTDWCHKTQQIIVRGRNTEGQLQKHSLCKSQQLSNSLLDTIHLSLLLIITMHCLPEIWSIHLGEWIWWSHWPFPFLIPANLQPKTPNKCNLHVAKFPAKTDWDL